MGTEACHYTVLDVNLSRLCVFQEMLFIGREACPYSVLDENLSRLFFYGMLWVQRHVPTVCWI